MFKNVLVGIDLSHSGPSGQSDLGAPVQEAVRQAVALAEKSSAKLTFFAAIEVPGQIRYLDLLSEEPLDLKQALTARANAVLANLVQDCEAKGITATSEVGYGSSWEEIIVAVLRHEHDLVVVGTRDPAGIERFLFGSTAQKLLRNCPCPVWVTKPGPLPKTPRIVVASDLSPVSDQALRVATTVAILWSAKIHLLHACDYPLDRVWIGSVTDDKTKQYHAQVRGDAEHGLAEQVARLGSTAATLTTEVIDSQRGADLAILKYLEHHSVDLLVMGTAARAGIPGMLVGNTAERLLQQVSCSMLAVKPSDFLCPVTLDTESQRRRAEGPYL
jgi:universal stress protein E